VVNIIRDLITGLYRHGSNSVSAQYNKRNSSVEDSELLTQRAITQENSSNTPYSMYEWNIMYTVGAELYHTVGVSRATEANNKARYYTCLKSFRSYLIHSWFI